MLKKVPRGDFMMNSKFDNAHMQRIAIKTMEYIQEHIYAGQSLGNE